MIRIAVCNDDPQTAKIAHNIILDFMNQLKMPFQISQFLNGSDFLAATQDETTFEISIIDIDRPDLEGLRSNTIESLKNTARTIILFSSCEAATLYDPGVNGFQRLAKERLGADLPQALQSAWTETCAKMKRIYFQSANKGLQRFQPQDILCIEYRKRRLYLYTQDSIIESKGRIPFQDFAAQFAGLNFYPCYRGIMVNLDTVQKITRKQVTMTNGQTLPVSRSHYQKIKCLLMH